jgi:hypothetical protein
MAYKKASHFVFYDVDLACLNAEEIRFLKGERQL